MTRKNHTTLNAGNRAASGLVGRTNQDLVDQVRKIKASGHQDEINGKPVRHTPQVRLLGPAGKKNGRTLFQRMLLPNHRTPWGLLKERTT